jgi:hypothetical protein
MTTTARPPGHSQNRFEHRNERQIAHLPETDLKIAVRMTLYN